MKKSETIAGLLQNEFAGRIPEAAIKSQTNWYVWVEGLTDPKLIAEIKYFAARNQVEFENYNGILKVGRLTPY